MRKILQSKGKGGSSERGDYEEDKKIMRPKDKDVSSEGALTTICLSGSQRRVAADTNGQRNKSEKKTLWKTLMMMLVMKMMMMMRKQ